MKYLALLIGATVGLSATNNLVRADEGGNNNARNLATLAEKWNITDPTFDYDRLEFDLDYGVSDYIAEGMFSHGIYDENCKEGNYEVSNNLRLFGSRYNSGKYILDMGFPKNWR